MKSKAKPPKHPLPLLQTLLFAAIGVLSVICIAQGIALQRSLNTPAQPPPYHDRINISLGSLEFNFTGGRAVKRDDAVVQTLRATLEDAAHKDIALGCETAHYQVIAHTDDDRQVLLGYGCDQPTARMFATYDGDWQLISPTNEFDNFGIPRCSHVTGHGINREIAPVCANGLGEENVTTTYTVR
ncbi:hypothetical protein JNJ66_00070 [Candidatus Saccharibacteria bacterium]|nr:hypothetical protein [Candidatus Saccharibacteria bacterium]